MKDRDKIKWLWKKMEGYHAYFIFAILTTITYSVMQLTVPVFSRRIIDRFFDPVNGISEITNHKDELIIMILCMVGLTFIRTIIVYRSCMMYEKVSQHILSSLRIKLFKKIQEQDMYFYDEFRTGDLMTRLTGDLDSVRHTIAWTIRVFIDNVTLFLTAAGFFIYLHSKVALCLLSISPLLLIITIMFKKKIAPLHEDLREELSQLNTAAQENIAGNRIVKAFVREDYEREKFDKRNNAYAAANKKTILTQLTYFPLIEFCANGILVILLLAGGIEMINGTFTIGGYVAFAGLTWAIAGPMRMISNLFNEFQRFSAAATKIIELENAEGTIKDPEKPVAIDDSFEGTVEFKNVSFSYGENEVLSDISFSIGAGKTVAIMGETGSGKTSIVNLIPRFYDPSKGEVLVNGINIKNYKRQDLRKKIGYATQDILLYSDSIDGNIAFGNPDMSEEDVKKYALIAAADEFVSLMPDGYDTIIGERGVGISGGQKQRVALARALAIKPEILILDDTTSAVDMETEKYIQAELKKLPYSCTKIIIAQRISSVKDADLIIYIKDGKIKEMGNHKELIENKKFYYDIYMLQGGDLVG